MAPTPAWAVPGAVEEGFDPKGSRVRKHGACTKARLAKT